MLTRKGKEEKPMANKTHYVVHNPNGGWDSKVSGGSKAIKHFDKQSDCIAYTRKISNNQDTEMRIQGRDGKFRAADSHGNDPCPPKG